MEGWANQETSGNSGSSSDRISCSDDVTSAQGQSFDLWQPIVIKATIEP